MHICLQVPEALTALIFLDHLRPSSRRLPISEYVRRFQETNVSVDTSFALHPAFMSRSLPLLTNDMMNSGLENWTSADAWQDDTRRVLHGSAELMVCGTWPLDIAKVVHRRAAASRGSLPPAPQLESENLVTNATSNPLHKTRYHKGNKKNAMKVSDSANSCGCSHRWSMACVSTNRTLCYFNCVLFTHFRTF